MGHADQPSGENLAREPLLELVRSDPDGAVRDPDPREALTTDTVDGVAPEHQAAATAAVAEAVAVASEEAAVEAAEAVVVTAEAVTQAAGRAVDAAESAKAARVVATDTALLADEQDARDAAREVARAEQHPGTLAPASRAPDRAEAEKILATAEERDSSAELRDRVADERERAASLRTFLKDTPYEEGEQHAEGLLARRAAALDRLASRTDRAAAASDRARLSAGVAPGSQAAEVSPVPPMSEVAAQLSHDLRVPLSANIASMELLEEKLRDHPDPAVAELLGHATRAGDRMVRMLEHHMTPPTPGDPAPMPEVDLAEIVRQVVLDSADLLEPVGAVVEVDELPVVRADPDAMYSVLQNLIANAVKFARPGVPAIVRISARRTQGGWRTSVRDNGVGLPDSSDLDVFSLFTRGTSAVTGHGIGLATVARIITTHGGEVGTAPTESGAEIWFELPAEAAVR